MIGIQNSNRGIRGRKKWISALACLLRKRTQWNGWAVERQLPFRVFRPYETAQSALMGGLDLPFLDRRSWLIGR